MSSCHLPAWLQVKVVATLFLGMCCLPHYPRSLPYSHRCCRFPEEEPHLLFYPHFGWHALKPSAFQRHASCHSKIPSTLARHSACCVSYTKWASASIIPFAQTRAAKSLSSAYKSHGMTNATGNPTFKVQHIRFFHLRFFKLCEGTFSYSCPPSNYLEEKKRIGGQMAQLLHYISLIFSSLLFLAIFLITVNWGREWEMAETISVSPSLNASTNYNCHTV